MIETFAGPSPDQLSQLDTLEVSVAADLSETLQAIAARLMTQSEALIVRRDVEGLLALNDGLVNVLQRPILDAWDRGWTLGSGHGILEMQLSVPARNRPAEPITFALSDEVKTAIADLWQMTPNTFRNVNAERAVMSRVLKLAGNFAKDTLSALKTDLLAAVLPQPDTGNPISRDELLERIQKRLRVGTVRANAIARTETTNSYTRGRLSSFDQSPLVTHLLFVSIHDHRRSEICESRDSMVVPVSDRAVINRNTPALHVHCRSTWSNLMPAVNPRHQRIIDKPGSLYSDRQLVPLPKGWNTVKRFR